MRLSNRQHDEQVKLELSMTSMIDVVFLLLIFFLVTTTFVRPEHQMQSAIKVDNQSAASNNVDLELAIIEIIPSGTSFVYKLGAVSSSDISEISTVLKTFTNKDDGAFVRVHDDAPFDMAAIAINACKTDGFYVVSYIPLK